MGKRGRKYPQRRERNLRVETLKAQKNSGISPALLKSNPRGRHEGNICHRARVIRAKTEKDLGQLEISVPVSSSDLFTLVKKTYTRGH